VNTNNPRLAPVQASFESGMPLPWVKVHQNPDYVYFSHDVHVNRGVSCFSCHGAVNEMQVVYQHEPQSMAWCLDCHRAPENFLRPPAEIYNMDWKPESAQAQLDLGRKFKEEWNVNPPVTCGGCHR